MNQNISTAVMQRRIEPHNSLDDFPTPPLSYPAIFEDLKQEMQREFLRAQARREVVDILLQTFERIEGLGFALTIDREVAETGATHLCLDVMLTPPDVRGRIAEIRAAQANCPEMQPAPEPPVVSPELPGESFADANSCDEVAAEASPAPAVTLPPAAKVVPTEEDAARADLPKVWTPEEDSRAVAIYAEAMAGGATKTKAAERVSAKLGRPFFGVQFRLKTKLGKLISAAIAKDAKSTKPAVEAVQPAAPNVKLVRAPVPSAPAAIPAPIEHQDPVVASAPDASSDQSKGQGGDAVMSASGRMPFTTAIPARQREWRAQMNVLGNPDPFTPRVDFGLVSDLLSGIHLNHISTDLGIDSKALRNRWEAIISPFSLPKGGIALSDQAYLLAELKARVSAGSGVAI